LAVVALGGGRRCPEDQVDLAVGFSDLAFIGEKVGADRPLGWVHGQTAEAIEQAAAGLRAAYQVGSPGGLGTALIIEKVVGL
jgi:thymidine phosphorylase